MASCQSGAMPLGYCALRMILSCIYTRSPGTFTPAPSPRHIQMRRRQPGLMPRPCHFQPGFKVAGEGGGIEQGALRAAGRQALAQGLQTGAVAGQAEDQRLIAGIIIGHQFRQPGGTDDAGRHPGSKSLAAARHLRHPRP